MITVLKVLGIIWLSSVLFLGILFLYYKLTNQPISVEYDGDDF